MKTTLFAASNIRRALLTVAVAAVVGISLVASRPTPATAHTALVSHAALLADNGQETHGKKA